MKKNKKLLEFKKIEITNLNQLTKIIGGNGDTNGDITTTHTGYETTRLCEIVDES